MGRLGARYDDVWIFRQTGFIRIIFCDLPVHAIMRNATGMYASRLGRRGRPSSACALGDRKADSGSMRERKL